jgi:4a-hydroxytetrahydrobiopterin dehydratase
MKKFSKITENKDNQKYFQITAEVTLIVKSETEGEAGYLADSILGSIKEQSDFKVQDILELTDEEYKKTFESIGIGFDNKIEDNSDEQKIIKTWEAEFGTRTPTTSEKMEFYHQMRNAGFDGILIMNALKDKISHSWLKNKIKESLSNGWKEISGKLEKTFQFKDFKEALDFINKVGQISESINHHPEIINVYNKVTLKLKTHDKNQITDLDYKMAEKVDQLFNI